MANENELGLGEAYVQGLVDDLVWETEVDEALDQGFTYDADEDEYVRETFEVAL